MPRRQVEQKVAAALRAANLPDTAEFLATQGHQLSGGQRQRVAIARAMTMDPALVVADEITTMLDASTAANMLRSLQGLRNQRGFAMLYITHDLALARKIAD